MRIVRSFMILVGVFFSCLALLAPFLSIDIPWGSEIWVYQAIRELNSSFHLAPTLNGFTFTGPNPLVPVILSLFPFSDILSLRVVSMLLGCLVGLGVFVFSSSLWGNKSGFCSALFTITSWGFITTFGTINATAVPVTFTVLAFLLFSQIYIKELNPWWYLLSYILMCFATITGGWIPLAFFIFSAVFLILLDLSPARFLSIKLAYGIALIVGMAAVVYLACRIVEGAAFAGSIFSYDFEQGFTARIWIWVKNNLPWPLLVIPAWIFGEGPKEASSWRSLIAPKTGYAMGLVAVLFSSHVQEGYAFLSIPFGGILVGYWMSRGFLIRQSLKSLRTAAVAGTAILVILSALFLIASGPVLEAFRTYSLDLGSAVAAAVFLITSALLLWFAKKQYTFTIVVMCLVSVLALSWYTALDLIPRNAEKPISYASQIRSFNPLLVFKDDLQMRGYTGYVGARVIPVEGKIVPVGEMAYLAVRTDNLKDLLKDLGTRMRVNVISTFKPWTTYALIRISPPVPRR